MYYCFDRVGEQVRDAFFMVFNVAFGLSYK